MSSYPENVGILAVEIYFPKRVCINVFFFLQNMRQWADFVLWIGGSVSTKPNSKNTTVFQQENILSDWDKLKWDFAMIAKVRTNGSLF